ncbi:hypothetical protein U1Q18_026734 [Sarracenia purpurea var. burkii]
MSLMANNSRSIAFVSADNSIGRLPDHLLIEIFIRVPISEWVQLSCVKKQWASLFQEECLWHAALIRSFPLVGHAKRWPGPIPQGLSKRRYTALYISKHIFSLDDELDEIMGHTYLFLKERLVITSLPPPAGILHGTLIDQFIACGRSRDKAHELASQIWIFYHIHTQDHEKSSGGCLRSYSQISVTASIMRTI